MLSPAVASDNGVGSRVVKLPREFARWKALRFRKPIPSRRTGPLPVDLGRDRQCLANGGDDLTVSLLLVWMETASQTVFQPLLAHLVGADAEFPDLTRYGSPRRVIVEPDRSVVVFRISRFNRAGLPPRLTPGRWITVTQQVRVDQLAAPACQGPKQVGIVRDEDTGEIDAERIRESLAITLRVKEGVGMKENVGRPKRVVTRAGRRPAPTQSQTRFTMPDELVREIGTQGSTGRADLGTGHRLPWSCLRMRPPADRAEIPTHCRDCRIESSHRWRRRR